MTHEKRLAQIKKRKCQSYGMIAAGCASFGGLVGGLWNQIGAGAIGAGFGGACGLIFGSCGLLEEAKRYEKWDAEAEADIAAEKA